MLLKKFCLYTALSFYCTFLSASEVSPYVLDFQEQGDVDYTNVGTLTNVLPVPSILLHGATIKTIGDLSIRLSGGQTIDFQDETAETLEISDLQISKIPEIIATGNIPLELSVKTRESLLGLKQAIEGSIGKVPSSRITSKDRLSEAFIFQGDDKKNWVVFIVSGELNNSYTMIILKGFEKAYFDRFLLQGAYGK